MIFLVEYDRARGKLVQLRSFSDSERLRAQEARLELELQRNRTRIKHEIVLLEAASERALRRTHRRYFESTRELASRTEQAF